MASLFILDVPEFSPLVESAANNGADVTRQGDYQVISADDGIVIKRSETGLHKAVWFGALTGGFIGQISRFDEETLSIE